MINLATIEDLKDVPTKGYVDAADALIPFAQVDATSTATAFTATVAGITDLRDGVIVMLKNGVVTSASGFTININNLGAKPVYSNMAAASRETTIFNINYTLLLVYDSKRVSGGCWINYRGYDANTNTIGYQLRTNNTTMTVTDTARYYKLYFTSADGNHWVPASANSTNNATSARAVNQRPIDPFGRIVYMSANTNYAAGANLSATTIWDQYTLVLGYSFNRTGAALELTAKKAVYVKCAPQADGSAIMDATEPIVQDLPSTADGKIYIYLGVAYDETHIELYSNHPVYHYSNGAIRLWTNAAESSGGAVDSVNGQTGAVVLDASDVGALPDSTTIPSKTSDLTNDSGFITGMAILSYGSSTWADFLAAYNANKVVYCRASSASDPSSGSQNRLAFMAYVNNASSPTEVEFQYYRSVSSHSDAQQGDQVYVYKLTSSGTWTVTVREAYTKIATGTGLQKSYSSGTLTLSASGGVLPSVSASDNGKVLRVVDGAWAAVSLPSASGVSF